MQLRHFIQTHWSFAYELQLAHLEDLLVKKFLFFIMRFDKESNSNGLEAWKTDIQGDVQQDEWEWHAQKLRNKRLTPDWD